MRLLWSPRALQHLRDARDHIAEDNPIAADALARQLMLRGALLERFPESGRQREDGRRSLALPPTAYSLVYRIRGDRITILAVWHGARQWPFAG